MPMDSLKNAFVFLSGAISRFPDYNAKAFLDAEKVLFERFGVRYVYNPIRKIRPTCTQEQAMLTCLHMLTTNNTYSKKPAPKCDALVSLPGWRESKGASLERKTAEACGIPCIDYMDLVAGDNHER